MAQNSRSTTPNKTHNATIGNISSIQPQLKALFLSHRLEQDFVVYTVKITDEQAGDSWTFDTRFSEFYQLNNAIIQSKRVPISDLPKFPKKKHLWSNNKDPQLIIKRRIKLERFLNHILTNERVKCLDCVNEFIKRSKREFQIFQNFQAEPKKTVNLAKDIEKNFLDEIDSSMSNSDFMEIIEKYEEYEKDHESPQRTASKFLLNYKREKCKSGTEFEEHNSATIKLKKCEEPDEINKFQDLEEKKPIETVPEQNTPVKTINRKETVKVVYMSPLLKIERSGSIKKQERLKMMENKYPAKRSFLKNYFGGLCGSCSE